MSIFDKLKAYFQSDKVDIAARFELLREAIFGTMSNFFMARDRETGQIVGLKIGDREKVDAFEARFKGLKKPSEGEIAISLKHPQVVDTYEHGVTNQGLRYLVMEYLPGQGLHWLIQNRDPILEGNRLRLIRQMAEALDYVHEAGYIHRDICPRNFICAPDGQSLKLIDFGLTLPATKNFMQPGNRTGTPLYMAPEVIRRRWTDQRLDIFAFGVTAYHLCAHELPWPAPEDPDKHALAAITHDTAEPRGILSYRPGLNKELAAAIMQCLAAAPKDRPQTAREFLRLIRDVEDDDES